MEIASNMEWRDRHLRLIKNAYFKAAFFDETYPIIYDCFAGLDAYRHLVDMNIFIINTLSGLMEINRPTMRSSEMPVKDKADMFNLEIVRHVNGTAYLSGTGAKSYQSETMFNEKGIVLKYSPFNSFVSERKLGIAFSLSALDALFHLGIAGTKNLLNSCPIA
ncbi:MAG: WbqC family protein [Saprospiraceae bacterium]|nr:WbqC family protein [Saprospiraceae bacterium]